MNKEITRERLPDPCPVDRTHMAVRTIRRGAGAAVDTTGNPQMVLIQYRCDNGCNAPRGWAYHGLRGKFKHRSGECRDPQVLHEMELLDHKERSDFTRLGTVLGVVMAIGWMAWIITSLTLSAFWGVPQAATIAATLAGMTLAGILTLRSAQKSQPTPPEETERA